MEALGTINSREKSASSIIYKNFIEMRVGMGGQ